MDPTKSVGAVQYLWHQLFPCGKWLHKIRKRPDDLCARCAKVGKKHVETVAHLQSVQCVSQVDAVTAAHNRCWNVIMDGIVKHGSEKREVQPIAMRSSGPRMNAIRRT